MRWLFLIPLTTGLVSGYVSYFLQDEIAYLTGAFSLVSLLICLFIAPWQLQLVILILVLLAVRFLWIKVNKQIEMMGSSFLEDNTNDPNKRTYRGISYSSEETEEVSGFESPKEGTYRGLPWKTEKIALNVPIKTKFVKKYRGIPVNEPELNPQDE